MTSFDAVHRRAKVLEARLETRVQSYSSIAQKVNADLRYHDEENPLLDSNEEEALSRGIESDLAELQECINNMREIAQDKPSGPHEEILIRRYHEIHFDYSSEYRSTSAMVTRKRQSMDLFANSVGSSAGASEESANSPTARLLRERNSLAASMRSINEVIASAFQAKDSLSGQRSSLAGANSGIGSIANNLPSFNRLIDGISRKKLKESIIVAVFTGILLCFTIWWVFLR
eukprot:GSChrysophyteH1.ASY1.ANO1.232.1 assembled CDS